MTHWSAQFVGFSHQDLGRSAAGVDCWGLAWLVYDWLGIPLPSYAGDYASTEERSEIAGLIAGAKPDWIRVDDGQELDQVDVREFDLITVRRGTLESHVGVVVVPGKMLHATRSKGSCIEDYTAEPFRHRVTGIWRHRRLAEGASL